MKKRRLNKTRILAALMSLCMIISLFNGIDLPHFFQNETIAQAEDGGVKPDPDEYNEETLEHMWDSDGDGNPTNNDYWNAARSYYACAGSGASFDQFGGVYKRTIFHVYAFEGETICLGSSVYNSGLGLNHQLKDGLSTCGSSLAASNLTDTQHHYADKDSVDIVMTDLKGNQIPIDIRNSDGDTTGYIASPQAEFAAVKMTMNSDGTFEAPYTDSTGAEQNYTPYTYKVKETGLYTFEFHSYDKTGTANPNNKNNKCIKSQWPTADTNYIDQDEHTSNGSIVCNDSGGLIAALNITVFDENCQKQTGRTYADFLSLQMSNITGKNVTESYYILTTDSYIYKMTFNNAMPYTYNFFSNNRGIFDNATGEIVYKSVKDISNSNVFQKMGSFFVYPGNKETEKDKSFYIFLEYPDSDLEGEIYQKAVQPDPATNIRFVGRVEIEEDGAVKEVPGAYEGVGGYFAFDVKEATTATLRLEFKGGLKDYNLVPVEISGVVKPNSTNYFYWDGKDGNGNLVPAGNYDLSDIVYTVTAKAGEIHFPIFDMECAPGGITFERMSHIYDKEGNRLDTEGSIYDLTKNVIYYDETAIYYGENVAVTGISEADVTGDPDNATTGLIKTFFTNYKGSFWQYRNLNVHNGEYNSRITSYIGEDTETIGKISAIRIGDHSHTTNVIKYFSDGADAHVLDDGEVSQNQKNMIAYLNSKTNPVGLSDNSGKETTNATNPPSYNATKTNGMSTTDYAIANYWTFIPAKPATTTKSDELLYIVDPPEEELFKLTGRVFYDVAAGGTQGNGKYDDTGENGEHLMSGVTLNLYKKTSDTATVSGKKYFDYLDGKMTGVTNPTANSYELVDTGVTRTDGSYVFTNLTYDKTNGTEYLYEVVRPDSSYTLTSGGIKATISYNNATAKTGPYGYYASHSFDEKGTGNEIQIIKVGGTGGVDPTKLKTAGSPDNPTRSVCAVDVGYYYATMQKSLWLKKTWDPETSPSNPNPASVIYELSYYSGTNGHVYDYRTLSGGGSWTDKNLFLPTNTNGNTVADYYVSAEYFIDGDYIYRYSFKFDTSTGKYSSFVADAYRKSLADILGAGNVPDNCTVNDLPDQNGDGVSDGKDLGSIKDWKHFNENEDDTTYRAVLDRNILADKTEITVTNAQKHGTIELFKYKETELEENALSGATFRLYQADMATTMEKINDASWRADNLVDAATTRSNGRLVFTGLESDKVYTLQELFAPDGYRITQEFYEVRPEADKTAHSGDGENVFFFGDKDTTDPDYAYVTAANALADTSLKIRKRIVGRAWQGGVDSGTKDSFTFDISNGFNLTADGYSDLGTNSDISVDTDEQSFQLDTLKKTQEQIIKALTNFAANFKSGSSTGESTVTIDYNSEYYNYVDNSTRPPVNISSADTKMSDLLLDVDPDSNAPTFQGVVFPMAGNYTFTIKENDFAEALNLEKSTYVYKVVVSVVRKLNEGIDEDTAPTEDNTHLEASVSNITYSEDGGSVYKTFAGSSPLFTNEYRLAPAEQTTSYNIVKSFIGRDWNTSDEFTVDITSADSETAIAVNNKNLVITGFSPSDANLEPLEEGKGWKYTFKRATDKLKFTSFKFNDIEFPVQYVHNKTGVVWDSEKEGKDSPDTTQIGAGDDQYSPHTMPVTYTFNISETTPVGAEGNVYKGITYDSNKYILTIVLNNTEKSLTSGEGDEEEDGIIEEIDVTLQKTDSAGNVIGTSNCKTIQHAMTQAEWSAETESTGTTYWYVDPGTKALVKRDLSNEPPTGTKIFIKKTEEHASTGTVFGTDGHTMTIENTYEAKYEWVPQVQKVVQGRNWLDDDAFKFTIALDDGSSDATGVEMPVNTEVEITNKDIAVTDGTCYKGTFAPIVFKKARSYTFNITETDINNTPLATYPITIVLEDNKDGTLTPTTINGEVFEDFDIEFVNEYEETSFDLSISKEIIGREWKTDDEFTFHITPDTNTLAAINDGDITMPTDNITLDASGKYYTATISGTTGEKTILKSLDSIKINNTKSLEPDTPIIYKFTISEVTDDLKNMYCRVPSYDLYIKVTPKTAPGSNSSENTLSAEYACVVTGATEPVDTSYTTTGDGVTIAFENVATGTLTVEKEVVSSNDDETEFSFTATFKLDADKLPADITEKERTVKVTVDGDEYTLVLNKDTEVTYTFSLKHGQSITFSNILPNTTYTITEGTEPTDYMFLRIIDKDGNNVYDEDVGQKVSGKIDIKNSPYEYTFISGKIHNLPSAGGTGSQLILLGTLALIIAAALFYALFYKNDKRREAR